MWVIERALDFDDLTAITADGTALTVPAASHDWLVGTTYAAGAMVVRDGYWWISQQNANTGRDPRAELDLAEPVWWGRVAAVAVRRPFDSAVRARLGADPAPVVDDLGQIDGPLVMTFGSLATPRRITAIRIEGIGGCTSVRCEVRRADGTLIYDRAVSLIDTSVVTDFLSWVTFVAADFTRTDALFWNVPGFAGYEIRLTFAGAHPEVGEVHGGQDVRLGTMLAQTEAGFDPFDEFRRNAFGDEQIIEQGYSNFVRYNLHVEPLRQHFVQAVINRNRARVQAYVGNPDLTWFGTSLLGVPRDGIRFPLSRGNRLIATLPIEGVSAG
jgi:hypothetical protein